jgi:high affinity sulfate transporter 1
MTQAQVPFWKSVFPVSRWLPGYQGSWLSADLVAGFTLAAYLLPAALGDASLANLPPEAGLYACLFSGLVFWLFCSGKQTVVTVTSAISLLVGSSLGDLAGGDVARFQALAACTALLVAGVAFVAWLIRAGVIVKFISETVMIGFKAGVALFLASTQLPKLFGFSAAHGGGFWERMGAFFSHLHDTNFTALGLGLAALALLALGKKFLPNKPVALVVVIAAIVAASFVDLSGHGVKLLGKVPSGLPTPGLPEVSLDEVNKLVPLALACFLLGAVETVAIGRMFSEKHGYRLNTNQEFLALAGANLATGLGHGFPVSGGMSQSLVNENGGARTPLSGLVAAGIVLIVALFLSELLHNLPQPVLAAVVLMAVTSLFKVSELRHLWSNHRMEFVVAIAALLGVLGQGLLRGVMVGTILSLILLLRRASNPHVAFLGRIPGNRRFSDMERHADNEPIRGMLAFRVESGVMFFNTEHIFDTVTACIEAQKEPPKVAVWDLSTSPAMDLAGARLVLSLHEELARRGMTLQLVEARSSVRDILRLEGVEDKVGRIDRFRSLADLVDDFETHRSVVPSPESGR